MSEQRLDPQCVFLQEQKGGALEGLVEAGIFGLESGATKTQPKVSVLVQFVGELEELTSAGLEIQTVAGDVVTGSVAFGKLAAVAAVDGVVVVEGSRAMLPELDLAVPESRANVVHTGPPGHRGSGVIIGVCDTGVDWRHENFIRGDGTSRVIGIWDQNLAPVAGEASPAGFGYGVEYSAMQINAALAGTGTVRHSDPGAHGTHVAGIAAGDGSAAGQGQPAGTFVGLAPEAEIIVVAVGGGGGRGLGDSARALDAVSYLFQRAAVLNRPVVVNMSLGDNVGPHDGTSLLERGLDNLLGGQGRAFVKSAGNAGGGGVHADGTVAPGGAQTVSFAISPGDATTETIDIWYEGADRFAFRITEPGGAPSASVAPNTTITLTLANGNRVFVDSRLNDPNNADNRIFLTIERGTAATIEAGTWSFTLTGTQVTNGRFDAWIQRGSQVGRFVAPHESRRLTISTPGTAVKVITAASYVTRGGGVGSIAGTSSRGPTRDGRPAPVIAAPGETIISVRSAPGGADPYVGMGGTSMAAPHVTGAIALMFQKNRNLTQLQIIDCVTGTARSDSFTTTTPNESWGAGKLDVAAAFTCAPAPGILITITGPLCPGIPSTLSCPKKTLAPVLCLKTIDPSCLLVTKAAPICGLVTRSPGCFVTIGPGCIVSRGPGCPPQTIGGCNVLPDPNIGINPGRPGGRTIIGQEDIETGQITWYGYDPYGELEAIAEGDETWSGPETGGDAS